MDEWVADLALKWPELPQGAATRIPCIAYVPSFTEVGVNDTSDLLDFGMRALQKLEESLRKVPGAMLADVTAIIIAIQDLIASDEEARRHFRAQLPPQLPNFSNKKAFIPPDKVESPRTGYDSFILRSLEHEMDEAFRDKHVQAADSYVAELLPPIVFKAKEPAQGEKPKPRMNLKSRLRHALFKSNILGALNNTREAADVVKLPAWVELSGWDFEGDNTEILEDEAFTAKLFAMGLVNGGALRLMPDMTFESSTASATSLRHLTMLHKKYPALTDVQIHTGRIESLGDATEALGAVATIAALSIENSPCRGDLTHLNSLAQAATNKPSMNLTLLSLSGCSKVGGSLSSIGSSRDPTNPAINQLFSGLTVLNLSGLTTVKGRLEDLCVSLPQLETLRLGQTKLSGSLEAVSSMKNLRELDIEGTNVEGKKALRPLVSCPRLTRLNLSDTKLEDATLESLATLLNLRELCLRRCATLAGDISALAACSSLEVLDLSAHKTMTIGGNLHELGVGKDGKGGLQHLKTLDLTNCRLIGGEMSAGLVELISNIRAAHGPSAVKLGGCGQFFLPEDLVTLNEWDEAVSAAAAQQAAEQAAAAAQRQSTARSGRRSRDSARDRSTTGSRESSSRVSSERTTKSRGSATASAASAIGSSRASSASAQRHCGPIVLVNGRADRIDLSGIGSLEGELKAFGRVTGIKKLDLSGTKVRGELSMLSQCLSLEDLDLSRKQKYTYGAAISPVSSGGGDGGTVASGDITGDLCGLPSRCRWLKSLKLRNCWRMKGECAEDLKFALIGVRGEIGNAWSPGGNLQVLDFHGTNLIWPRDSPKAIYTDPPGFRTYLEEKDCIILGCNLRGEPPPPKDEEEEEEGEGGEDDDEVNFEGRFDGDFERVEEEPVTAGDFAGAMLSLALDSFIQTGDEIELTIPLPPGVTKKDVRVKFHTERLTLSIEGNEAAGIKGSLGGKVDLDGCTWAVTNGNVVITMEKRDPGRQWAFAVTKD